MPTIPFLRAYVSQRLAAAVDEIIGVFERTITEYEEEIDRQRRLLGAEQLPSVQIRVNIGAGVLRDVQPPIIEDAKIPPEQQQQQQQLSLSPGQEAPEAPCIKEEPQDVWTGQELQGLKEGAGTPESRFPLVSVKSEDGEEKPQTSLLHQGRAEERGEARPPAQPTEAGAVEAPGGAGPAFDLDVAGFLKATSDGQLFLSQCLKAETEDWHRATEREPHPDVPKDSGAASRKRPRNQKKLYKCPACGKTFKHNTALQRHTTCHTGERPFHCTVCGKTFRQKGSLHIHMRKHTGEKPFSCSLCGKHFTQSGTLAAHMRIHTGEKPFSCSVCAKRCNERGTLVRHMRVHTGEKPFACALCGKRFSEKGNLNKHKRVHTGEKPFGCGVCDKRFGLLSHLKHHKCPGKRSEESIDQRDHQHSNEPSIE